MTLFGIIANKYTQQFGTNDKHYLELTGFDPNYGEHPTMCTEWHNNQIAALKRAVATCPGNADNAKFPFKLGTPGRLLDAGSL
jgi:hypothetical protein